MNRLLLHPRLEADTLALGRLPLSLLRLMNDATWPWLILVPQRPGFGEAGLGEPGPGEVGPGEAYVREICELPPTDRALLIEEIALVSDALRDLFRPDKINVGALGNLVPQLHVHVLARFTTDPAWPAPVWGKSAPVPYESAPLADIQSRIAARLGTSLSPG